MIFSNITLHWYHFTKVTHSKIMHVMFFVRHIIAMDNLFISGYCVVVGDHSFLRYYIHILITRIIVGLPIQLSNCIYTSYSSLLFAGDPSFG